MKKKLKEFRQMVADAKKAWIDARKEAKLTAAEIKALLDAYQAKAALLEAFEADGKKDDDEVELPAADKTQPANVVDLKELTDAISKSVNDALAAKLPDALKGQVTLDGIKLLVDDALKKAKLDSSAPTAEQLQGIVAAVVDEQVKKLNLPSKHKHAAGDGDDGNRRAGGAGGIAVPYGLSKGNLPLHMKQLLNCLMRKNQDDGIDADVLKKGTELGDQMFLGMRTEGVKALTTSGTGTGAEWLPRDLSSELYRRLYLESQIAQAFMANEVPMPSDPYDYPLLTTDPTFKLNTVENREAEPTDIGTAKFTLATKKLMALVQYSYEADEDSIIPLLPTIQMSLARAAARSLENAIINGDTTATHQDSDVTDPNDQARAWKGFRKLALAVTALKSDLSTGGISRLNLLALLKNLGKWGSRTGDLLWIVGARGWTTLLGLDEFALAYARGSTPTFAGGAPPNSPYGGQIAVSEQQRENLNASGVYDGVTTSKGCVLLVNRLGFVMGSRREFTVEAARNIKSQTNDIVASFRKAFQPVETPSSTILTVAIGYNYAS